MTQNRRWIRVLALSLSVVWISLAAASQALAGGAVQGTVATASGNPVASAWVVFEQKGSEKGKSLTGDDGKYYVAGLGPGDYEVTVRKGDRVLYHGTAHLSGNQSFDIRVG
jgi:hypothetical protein